MDYITLASTESIGKTIEALEKRGIKAEFVNTKEEALSRLAELLPASAELMTAGSTTLEQIGFIDILMSKSTSGTT